MVYNIEWDGRTVTFPPVGHRRGAVPVTPTDEGAFRLSRFAVATFNSVANRPMRISVPVVLIPRRDEAVSVAAPQSVGGDKDARHLGYLRRRFVKRLGFNAIDRLADLSSGEIRCTAIVKRNHDYDVLDFDDPDLTRAYAGISDIRLDIPRAQALARAIEDFGRQRTDHVLEFLRTYETAESPVGALSVTINEGRYTAPSSLNVVSDDVLIGWVALGYLFLEDERQRATVLNGLSELGIPAAASREPRPEVAASPEWDPNVIPNVFVSWAAGGHHFAYVPLDGPGGSTFHRTFARYNPTTKTLWVEDRRLVAPACIVAARLGLEIVEIGLPPESWTLRQRVRRGVLEDRSYDGPPPYKVRQLQPHVAELVPEHLFDGDLDRFAQVVATSGLEPTELKSGQEPTELLERLTPYRLTLFPDHTYFDEVGTCRICERPAGRFRTPICTETLAYCHRCLAVASNGLSTSSRKHATSRATVAVRALAEQEFGGAAFVEAQLATVRGDPAHPVEAGDIDRRLLLRIAITRRQLAWTHILIEAGLADTGIRLSRGTVLKAIDGHICSSMLEKAVDDFFHDNGIDHTREPLYPFDKQLNPNTRRRADWLLSDGTFIELWGMLDDPGYAEKMRQKIELAARHHLRLVGISPADTRNLSVIFADWAKK